MLMARSEKIYGRYLVIILCIGFLFIPNSSYLDWGDDYAQYLQQADNIIQLEKFDSGTYLFNPDFQRIGPLFYPSGYSFSLAAIKLVFTDFIWGAKVLNSFFLSLLFFVTFILLKQSKTNWILALLAALFLTLKVDSLKMQSELISDLAFNSTALLCLYYIQKNNLWLAIISAAVAYSFRSVGLILILLGTILIFIDFRQNRKLSRSLIYLLSLIVIAIIPNLISGYYSNPYSYLDIFSDNSLMHVHRSTYYSWYWKNIKDFFFESNQNVSYLLVGILGVGSIFSFIESKSFWNPLFLFLYLLLIAIYPYYGGYRFILLPMLIIGIEGVKGLIIFTNHFSSNQIALSLLFACLLSFNSERIYKSLQYNSEALPGPSLSTSNEAFMFIKENIHDDDRICFLKPRALSYFTKKQSFATEPYISLREFKEQLKKMHATHLMKSVHLNYPVLDSLIAKESELNLIYSNYDINIYKIN